MIYSHNAVKAHLFALCARRSAYKRRLLYNSSFRDYSAVS